MELLLVSLLFEFHFRQPKLEEISGLETNRLAFIYQNKSGYGAILAFMKVEIKKVKKYLI